jgi:hypothetical protein
MPAVEEVFYRLRLVLGFLKEARQDFNLGRLFGLTSFPP